MEEGINSAVPMLIIPFLGDQYANANRLEKLRVGNQLDLLEMTEDSLRSTILETLKPDYKKSMKKLRDLVYDQPMTSLDKAIFWTEYVIRHKGTRHMEFAGRSVPFYEQYCLDFVAIFIAASALTIYVSKKILRKLFGKGEKKGKIE